HEHAPCGTPRARHRRCRRRARAGRIVTVRPPLHSFRPMRTRSIRRAAPALLALGLFALTPSATWAQGRQGTPPRDSAAARGGRGDSTRAPARDSERPTAREFNALFETPPVVTHHSVRLNGQTLSYTATTGMLPIRNDTTGFAEGAIFFVAY